jgi:SAM-dependent methyltransferase
MATNVKSGGVLEGLESKFYEYLIHKGHLQTAASEAAFRTYLQFLHPGETVVDLGCGQGTFLDLLQMHGCNPIGVDSDPSMIDQCRARGHQNVIVAEALGYLQDCPPHSFDVLFASNFVEHLPANVLLEFLNLVHRALRPGGRILLATPNAESVIVHLHEFWRDATHVRLYNRQLLEFLLWYTHFELLASGENAATQWLPRLPPMPDQPRSSQGAPAQFAVNPWAQFPTMVAPRTLIGRIRRLLAQLIYAIIKEVDLRVTRVEKILAISEGRLSQLDAKLDRIEEQNAAFQAALLAMHPAREIYVLGRKP